MARLYVAFVRRKLKLPSATLVVNCLSSIKSFRMNRTRSRRDRRKPFHEIGFDAQRLAPLFGPLLQLRIVENPLAQERPQEVPRPLDEVVPILTHLQNVSDELFQPVLGLVAQHDLPRVGLLAGLGEHRPVHLVVLKHLAVAVQLVQIAIHYEERLSELEQFDGLTREDAHFLQFFIGEVLECFFLPLIVQIHVVAEFFLKFKLNHVVGATGSTASPSSAGCCLQSPM